MSETNSADKGPQADTPSTNVRVTETGVVINQRENDEEKVPGPVAIGSVIKLKSNTLSNSLTREVLVYRGSFTSLQAKGDLIIDFDPWALWFLNSFILDKVAAYHYIRGSMRVRLDTICPTNSYGLYNLSALCNGGQTNYEVHTDEIGDMEQFACVTHSPNKFINCSRSTSVDLILPFVYHKDFISLPAIDDPNLWVCQVFCFYPIKNALDASGTNGTFNIYCELQDDYEIVAPRYQSGKAKDGWLSSGLKSVGGIVQGAGELVPSVAPWSLPIGAGLTALGDIASWFGFTRSSAYTAPTPFVQRAISSISQMDGEDTSENVSLLCNNAISIDPTIGGGLPEDESSFASLFAKWTLVNYAEYYTSTEENTTLLTFPVTPFAAWQLASDSSKYVLTTAGYVGLPFKYWRGDMEYKIMTPCSAFHRGSLQFVWHRDRISITGDPTTTLLNAIVDVDAASDYDFSVGYAAPEGLKESMVIGNNWLTPFLESEKHVNGYVSILNPTKLQVPNGSSLVPIFVFARAKPNMEFVQPANATIQRYYDLGDAAFHLTTQPLSNWEVQSSGAVGNQQGATQSFDLVIGGDGYKVAEIHAGETVKSVRGLLQKFSLVWWTKGATFDDSYSLYFRHFPTPVTGSSNFGSGYYASVSTAPMYSPKDFYPFSWANWYSILFTGIRGSTRYKFVVDEQSTNVGAFNLQVCEDLGHTSGSVIQPLDAMEPFLLPACHSMSEHSGIQTLKGGGAEFQFPYYYPLKFFKPRLIANFTYGDQVNGGDRLDAFGFRLYSGTPVRIYKAMADDVSLLRFRRVPPLKMNPTL